MLQDVFKKIWFNADKYRADAGSAWAWICQLARNQAIDRYRQTKRLNETDDSSIEEEASFNTSAIWPEHVDLGRCLDQIKEQQRTVLVSSYVYGWSHSELVKKFDLPLGTLKSWIRRSLEELKTCLEA